MIPTNPNNMIIMTMKTLTICSKLNTAFDAEFAQFTVSFHTALLLQDSSYPAVVSFNPEAGPMQPARPVRWSFFRSDGMVNVFFQGTIGIDGFSMVLPALNHHH